MLLTKGMGLAFLLTCARTRKWHRTPMRMPQRQKALHKVCWRKRDCPTKLRPKFPGICNCCSAPWAVRGTDHAVKRKLTRVFLVPTPGQGQFHNNPFPAEGVTFWRCCLVVSCCMQCKIWNFHQGQDFSDIHGILMLDPGEKMLPMFGPYLDMPCPWNTQPKFVETWDTPGCHQAPAYLSRYFPPLRWISPSWSRGQLLRNHMRCYKKWMQRHPCLRSRLPSPRFNPPKGSSTFSHHVTCEMGMRGSKMHGIF